MCRSYQMCNLGFKTGTLRILIGGCAIVWASTGCILVAQPTLPAEVALPLLPLQSFSRSAPLTLKGALEATWARQPEAQSLAASQAAAQARQVAADGLTPAPIALGLSTKTDRLNQNQGNRETEVGVAIPLWWPSERARAGALAFAEAQVIDTRARVAKWRIAGVVRESYWAWQFALADIALAQAHLQAAQRLASDVVKRVAAGDLARIDQNQADGNVIAAQTGVIERTGVLLAAELQLRVLTGKVPLASGASALALSEVMPNLSNNTSADVVDTAIAGHPEIVDIFARLEIAKRNTELIKIQGDANPELSIAAIRARGDFTEPYRQSLNIGVRIPFSGGARQRSKAANASAEFIELTAQANAVRDKVVAAVEVASQRLVLARQYLDASKKRAQLTDTSRGFIDKAFRAGEADFPQRLRLEREAADAANEAARAEISVAQAISTLQQALGLLPG